MYVARRRNSTPAGLFLLPGKIGLSWGREGRGTRYYEFCKNDSILGVGRQRVGSVPSEGRTRE